MKKILAAVDFSDVTERIVALAADTASAFDAELRVIHVATPDPDFVGYDPGPQTERDAVARHFREEHQQLQMMVGELRNGGVDARALLIQGPTGDKILEEAESFGAELIILGSHGHGALRRALLGSVSEFVAHRTQCPVMIVPVS